MTARGPEVTSQWNWSFNVATDDEQTRSTGTTVKWSMSITDIITGQLTLSSPVVSNGYTSKCLGPHLSNFNLFDIQALWHSSLRVSGRCYKRFFSHFNYNTSDNFVGLCDGVSRSLGHINRK